MTAEVVETGGRERGGIGKKKTPSQLGDAVEEVESHVFGTKDLVIFRTRTNVGARVRAGVGLAGT